MPALFLSLFKRMMWSIVANAALRSNNTIQPQSDGKNKSFVIMRAVLVL